MPFPHRARARAPSRRGALERESGSGPGRSLPWRTRSLRPWKSSSATFAPSACTRLAHHPGDAAVPPGAARLLSAWRSNRGAGGRSGGPKRSCRRSSPTIAIRASPAAKLQRSRHRDVAFAIAPRSCELAIPFAKSTCPVAAFVTTSAGRFAGSTASLLDRRFRASTITSCVGMDRTEGRRDLEHWAVAWPGGASPLIATGRRAAPTRPRRNRFQVPSALPLPLPRRQPLAGLSVGG